MAARRQRKLRWKRHIIGSLSRRLRRTQEAVEENYSRQWEALSPEALFGADGGGSRIEWDKNGFLANSNGLKRIHALLMMRAIASLKPKSVLEIGFGAGQMILPLAARFPDIRFAGIEFTEGGFLTADRMRRSENFSEHINNFSPEPPIDIDACKKIELQRANAADLPYGDNEFDLVYTVHALEQMEEIRERVLSEISRVSRKHVVMIEPFRDWNANGIKRNYIVANDYFAARLSDLAQFSMTVLYANADFPSKITLGVGMVCAEVTDWSAHLT